MLLSHAVVVITVIISLTVQQIIADNNAPIVVAVASSCRQQEVIYSTAEILPANIFTDSYLRTKSAITGGGLDSTSQTHEETKMTEIHRPRRPTQRSRPVAPH